jgi:hypothetical protein
VHSVDTPERRALLEACQAMRVQLRQEKQLLNEFQLQRETIEKFWVLEKKKREELKMELRAKIRQRQDLEDKQAFELKARYLLLCSATESDPLHALPPTHHILQVYKQKIAHLQHEIQSGMADVKIAAEKQMKLLQEEDRYRFDLPSSFPLPPLGVG